MKKLHLLMLALVALLTAPAASFAQAMAPAWTSPGIAGSITDSISIFNATAGQEGANGQVTFKSTASGNIVIRYNVVNTAVLPMNKSTGKPPWTTVEMAYIMPAGGSTITAKLYKIPACIETAQLVCQITGIVHATVGCDICTFPNTTFDYFNNTYMIEVTMNRPSTAVQAPTLCSLRVFN